MTMDTCDATEFSNITLPCEKYVYEEGQSLVKEVRGLNFSVEENI